MEPLDLSRVLGGAVMGAIIIFLYELTKFVAWRIDEWYRRRRR